MNKSFLSRLFRGEITRTEQKKFFLPSFCLILLLILIVWILYPAENEYSIMTHTFSFLGSFNSEHNPQWWWIFTIALLMLGFVCIPLVIYLHRRFVKVAAFAARFNTLLLLIGCLGMILVAIFPDAGGIVVGDIEWTDIHGKVSLLAFGGFGIGFIFDGILLAKDRFKWFPHGGEKIFDHSKVIWPYLMFIIVVGVAAYFLIAWEFIYLQLKAADPTIGSHWSAALNTIYSFPLWENIGIYTLILFLIWFPFTVPEEI
jgi:hypothetical protein